MTEKAGAKKIFNFSLLRRIFQFAAPYKNKFYSSLLLAVVLAIMAPIRPFLIQYTINKYIAHFCFLVEIGFIRNHQVGHLAVIDRPHPV